MFYSKDLYISHLTIKSDRQVMVHKIGIKKKKKKETTLFKVAIWGHPLLQIMHITGGGHNLNDTGNDTNYGRLRGSSTCDKT